MSIKTGSHRFARMFQSRSSYLLRLIGPAICGLVAASSVFAAGPSVTAVLTSSSTVVGQPVQLQIKVTGSSSARPPGQIFVDGLDIRYTGQSQLLEGRNFQFSYSFIYNYTIMPIKAGSFKIPPQMVEARGSAMHTPALTLQVADSGSTQAPRPSNRSSSTIDPSKIAFAELTLSKTSAYVGEGIPGVRGVGVQ